MTRAHVGEDLFAISKMLVQRLRKAISRVGCRDPIRTVRGGGYPLN